MKNNVIGVFVLENQEYEEISYSEFLSRCSIDEAYRNKHFIYVSKRLMEVSRDDYVRHYKELEHIRYLKNTGYRKRSDFDGEYGRRRFRLYKQFRLCP